MRKMKKFADGGRAARGQSRYDRMVKDIESDFEKAKGRKSGRALEVAQAKYEQRMADAKDDLAKARGEDRSATRAAEKAAESNLTMTRRYGASTSSAKVRDAEPIAKTMSPSEIASKVSAPDTSPARRAPARSAPARSAPARSAERRVTPTPTPAPTSTSKINTVGAAPRFLSREEPRASSQMTSTGSVPRMLAPMTTAERRAAKLEAMRVAAEAPGASTYARDRYRYAKETGMYAKGGKIDGCAVRGKTRAK